MLNKKVKGGALQFVLFIGVVIAILLLSFIGLTYAHRYFQKRGEFLLKAVEQANNGINYSLHNDIVLGDSVTIAMTEENDLSSEIKATKKYWGLYELVSVKSSIHNQEFIKIALVGGWNQKGDRYSLFLKESNRPLVVVENTNIQGQLMLPRDGLRPGNMGGKSFTGSLSPPNKIKPSTSRLPKLSKGIMDKLELWLDGEFGSELEPAQMNYPLNFKNSFKNKTLLLGSNGQISLDVGTLIGNVVVFSSSKITIGQNMKINDAIVIAPFIEIDKGFKGNLQAFASKELIVEKDVVLEYPSSLALYNKGLRYPKASITINEGADVKGGIVYWDDYDEKEQQLFTPQIEIHKGATVNGEIYCSRGLELLGKVKGSITTSYFIVNKFGSVYQNHIYGGQLNVDWRQDNYTGLLFNSEKKKIMKWLY
ncbi:hypothetical protein HX109_10975 [Galbibacter sp. BG1]|uniref:hypothetical protein n=1 Tax=Galbibacter sp. BG1 TaxID=1170699 RepID=UPI0015C14F5B|nr:hypothetical protein [Galbibacter sp. BG1]QLE02051.1 hypothetical protein HX109_10975 [Galbibacter sp. BG1]